LEAISRVGLSKFDMIASTGLDKDLLTNFKSHGVTSGLDYNANDITRLQADLKDIGVDVSPQRARNILDKLERGESPTVVAKDGTEYALTPSVAITEKPATKSGGREMG
jgi:hypothetical protein